MYSAKKKIPNGYNYGTAQGTTSQALPVSVGQSFCVQTQVETEVELKRLDLISKLKVMT